MFNCQYSFQANTPLNPFCRCPVKSADPLPCGSGSFAPAGSTYCHGCPLGTQCPTPKLASHQLCANGSFTAAENATSCSECPAGSKCPDPAVGPVECANGTYSKAGATHCIECPGGHKWAVVYLKPYWCIYCLAGLSLRFQVAGHMKLIGHN